MSEESEGSDLAVVCGPTEDRVGLRIVRARDGQLEAGEVRPVREGQPLNGEMVRLHPQEGRPWLCKVESVYPAPSERALSAPDGAAHSRSRVPTRAYLSNWERIFGADEAEDAEDEAALVVDRSNDLFSVN